MRWKDDSRLIYGKVHVRFKPISRSCSLLVAVEAMIWYPMGMPTNLTTAHMTSGITVEAFILSQPPANRSALISAASECLRRKYPLNSCELYSMARELLYTK